MNTQVDQVIAKGVVLAYEPVEGEAEIGDRAFERSRGKGFGKQGLPEGFRQEVGDVERVVLGDVRRVVENPWGMQCVYKTNCNN